MLQIDTDKPVLVTGATGYVAGWLIKRLLEEGVTVHAAVRNPLDTSKIAHLSRLADELPGKICIFKADLLAEGSYDEAMQDCAVVFHTASPFTLAVNDPQTDLVDPAQKGTRNVLESANRTPSVNRVVLTSSCAAMYGDNADLKDLPHQTLTEAVWNTSSSLKNNPYSYSKTLAEREAWTIAGKQSRWELVVINPSLVLGPGLNPHATSESFNLLKQLGDGRMKAGVADIGIGVVDVRDVTEAHVRAAFLPNASGRHIVSGHNASLPAIANALLPAYEAFPLPRRILPKWFVWMVGPLVDSTVTRQFVSRNVGHPWRADNTKSIRELQMTYRSLQDSARTMFQQMIDSGQIASN